MSARTKQSKRPTKRSAKGKASRRNDFHMEEPEERKMIPADQLQLAENQLKEEHTKAVTATDPNAPNNPITWSNREGNFEKRDPGTIEHMTTHFSLTSQLCHRDSDIAQQQIEDTQDYERQKRKQLSGVDLTPRNHEGNGKDANCVGEARPVRKKLLKNQFNFSERAAQTFNHPMRNRQTQTVPPPTNDFCNQCDQAVIFDTYLAELLRVKHQANAPSKKLSTEATPEGVNVSEEDRILRSKQLKVAVHLMERAVNHNSEATVYSDLKYYASEDTDMGPNGHLLPLWSFTCNESRKKTVTAVCWNPKFHDLFAVSFGSYSFTRQTRGLVCCYTLKNTSHPEFIINTESGVMCLDFHPQYPALLAIGCYDGSVAVYDVRKGSSEPIYKSDNPARAHTDPVWQVKWHVQEMSADLSFYSISSDGRIVRWIMTQNEMKAEDLMSIKSKRPETQEDLSLLATANGACFDFHPKHNHQLLVGTEEGFLFQCNTAYTSDYTRVYKSHNMQVYTIKWNPFHDRTFLTASDDWTLKLWDSNLEDPVISYDLKTSVSDACWCPFSSVLFAACTADGRVHIFNLAVNKNEPLQSQRVIKKGTLTHIRFAHDQPIVIVGDDRGQVVCLKLSPGLLKGIDMESEEIVHDEQVEALDKVLTVTGANVLDLKKLNQTAEL